MLPLVRHLSPVARRLQLRKACAADILRLQRAKAQRVHLRVRRMQEGV